MSSHEMHVGSGHEPKQSLHDLHDKLDFIVPPRTYMIVAACLLILTGTTVWVSYLDLNIFNPIVALAIAVIKGSIVVLFFMHVKYSSRLTKLTVFGGLFTFIVLVGMTLSDYFTRAWGRW